MAETAAALLLAHVVADFLLQPTWMAQGKRRPGPLLLHTLIVLVTAQAALGQPAAWQLLPYALAHGVIDAIKARLPQTLPAFTADQILHLATIVALATLAPDLWTTGTWGGLDPLPAVFLITAGAIGAVSMGGHAIGLLVARWTPDLTGKGLPGAGRLIGQLERALIYAFVLTDTLAGIGFLVAAKSILRFDTAQKAGEYVIVGTLASVGWALAWAEAVSILAALLPPIEISPKTP